MSEDEKTAAPETRESTKKRYEAPKILYKEELEAMAAVCNPPGKGDPAACPMGPISS